MGDGPHSASKRIEGRVSKPEDAGGYGRIMPDEFFEFLGCNSVVVDHPQNLHQNQRDAWHVEVFADPNG